MKEYFPLPDPSGVAEAVDEWLSDLAEKHLIMPALSAKVEKISAAKEIQESLELRQLSAPFPPIEDIVRRAENIIANYRDRSLNTLLAHVGLPMPQN